MLLKFLPRGRMSSSVCPSSQGKHYKPQQDSIKVHSGQAVNLLGFLTEPRGEVITEGMGTPSPTDHTWKNLPNRKLLPSCIDGVPALVSLGLHCLPQATYCGVRCERVAGFSGNGLMPSCFSVWGCTLSTPSKDDLLQCQGAVGHTKMAVAWLRAATHGNLEIKNGCGL